jgi:leucyl/phenylalanyl-tRNA---protein transferase
MAVFQLLDDDWSFPHPSYAESSGLLAVGGDLLPQRLVSAYQNGIFPWFEEDGVFYWFSPDPRCVVFPSELKIHKSMRSVFNQQRFRYSLDTCFEHVMKACGETSRKGEQGTWISPHFLAAYSELHQLGIAHSVEVWEGETLVGGLYGLSIGKMFFGESMFTRVANASKAGFITLVQALKRMGFKLIDCQMETPHLLSLGARGIARREFLDALQLNVFELTLLGRWRFNDAGLIDIVPEHSNDPYPTPPVS